MFSFTLNGKRRHVRAVSPNTTLLQYLRDRQLCGTKEGCAEGDCGACTVTVWDQDGWRAINACLVPLPSLAGRHLLTVEGLADGEQLHPAQQAMVDTLGSQCGYCTPGFVMSIFEACHRSDLDAEWKKDDQLCGNLCRCTGYRPIREALDRVAGSQPPDDLVGELQPRTRLDYRVGSERFFRPASLTELWPLLSAFPDAALVAGATDLGLRITQRGERFQTLISLEALPLDTLERVDTADRHGWRIGATLPLSELEAADPIPVLTRMLRYFASRQIKHRATLGGNLVNASPIGDSAPVLMALGARVVLRSERGARELSLEDFFVAYRQTALAPGEILEAVWVPDPPPDTKLGAYKVSRRREMDISAVSAGFFVRLSQGRVEEVRLCYGGMAGTTARALGAEQALLNQPWSEDTLERAIAALDFAPFSDHRGSAWYRNKVAENLLRGFYLETQGSDCPLLADGHVGTVQP